MDKYHDDVFFTIVIPTRERSDTLMHSISTALSQDYKNYEVLVSDNASLDQTREKVKSINDSRLRYINTGKRVSMSENWEFALSHVEEGWVTVLGDDDAILPGALSSVNRIIKKTGTLAVRSNGCSYKWPSLMGSSYGQIDISTKKGYEVRCSRRSLQKVLDGKLGYSELPMLYNGGFISTTLIKKAKEKSGNLFCSMIPDVYSAIVFTLLSEDYVYSYEPLAINGASIHSGGTAGFERVKKERPYDPVEKFFSEKNIPFHEALPLIRGRPVLSISVCVYEAYLQAEVFHDLKNIITSHSKQLVIAIAKSGPNLTEVLEWGQLFSAKHQIKRPNNFEIRFMAVFLFIRNVWFRLSDLFDSFSISGCSGVPLLNVYEASVVCGLIKVQKPSVFQKLASVFQKLAKKVYRVLNFKK